MVSNISTAICGNSLMLLKRTEMDANNNNIKTCATILHSVVALDLYRYRFVIFKFFYSIFVKLLNSYFEKKQHEVPEVLQENPDLNETGFPCDVHAEMFNEQQLLPFKKEICLSNTTFFLLGDFSDCHLVCRMHPLSLLCVVVTVSVTLARPHRPHASSEMVALINKANTTWTVSQFGLFFLITVFSAQKNLLSKIAVISLISHLT